MKIKIILANIMLLPIILFGAQMGVGNKNNNLEERIITKNINSGNSIENYSQDDLTFYGKNYGNDYRVFLDSTNDKNLPKIPGSIDYLIGKGAKDEWYEHLIQGIEINVLDYASSKSEFLNRYGAINIKYDYMFNFWNSKKGWTYPQGKKHSYFSDGYTYVLKGENNSEKIIEKTDSSHKSNEKARIVLYEEWNDNYLIIKMHLGVWYHWAWGSVYNHASLAQLKNDEYTFISTNTTKPIKQGVFGNASSFSMNNKNLVTGLSTIDLLLSLVNADFGMGTLTTQFFSGQKRVGNIQYFIYISIIWYPNSLMNKDTTKLIKGEKLSRQLFATANGINLYFRYENSKGQIESTNSVVYNSVLHGIKLYGSTQTFFIYN